MNKLIACLCSLLFFSACLNTEPSMSSVMNNCEGAAKFHNYVNCIKTNYTRYPDRRIVKSFFAQLDAIKDDLRLGRTSETRARADAHLAYDITIGRDNANRDASAARAWSNYQNSLPKTTNCSTFGSQINCTTW